MASYNNRTARRRLLDYIRLVHVAQDIEEKRVLIPKSSVQALFKAIRFFYHALDSYQKTCADDLLRMGPPRDYKSRASGRLGKGGMAILNRMREERGVQIRPKEGESVYDCVIRTLGLVVVDAEPSGMCIDVPTTSEVGEFRSRLREFEDSLEE